MKIESSGGVEGHAKFQWHGLSLENSTGGLHGGRPETR